MLNRFIKQQQQQQQQQQHQQQYTETYFLKNVDIRTRM
jgi:hypothetical protein